MLDLIAKKRLAGIALIVALGSTGAVACEGDVDVSEDGGGGEEEGVDVEGEVGGEGEGEEGGD